MPYRTTALLAAALLVPRLALAFESDVHFGLTQWLAIKAGFTPAQADAIATGNMRIDSWDISFVQLVTTYACLAKDREVSALVEQYRYPSPSAVPAPAEQRAVPIDSERARKAALEAVKVPANQASLRLLRFGESLHAVQDSWAHQGIPDVPRALDGAVACDPALAWSHPAARGGWNSHKADLTHEWPADTVAMAKATYDLLQQYPAIGKDKRSPKAWTEIKPALDGFVRASTKTDKKKWFAAEGVADVSFLEGISLPDGAQAFDLRWEGHRLVPLPTLKSGQHKVEAEVRDFYGSFFSQWAASDDFDAIATSFGVALAPPSRPAKGGPAPAAAAKRPAGPGAAGSPPAAAMGLPAPMTKDELSARLRVWRVRDHGRVAEFAHTAQSLSSAQLKKLVSMTKDGKAFVRYESPSEAYLALSIRGAEAQPILGYFIATVAPSATGNPRAVATTRFRHAPYDTIVVLAERIDGRWRIVSLGPIVDH